MLYALVGGLTLVSTVWLVTVMAAQGRQWALLKRVRSLCASSPLRDATSADFSERWASAGGLKLPEGWATAHVRELMRLKAGGYPAVEALSRLSQKRAHRRVAMLRAFATGVLFLGSSGSMSTIHLSESAPQFLWPLAGGPSTLSQPVGCALSGLVGFLWLFLLSLFLSQIQQAFLLELETFTLHELTPHLLIADDAATAERFAQRVDESSRRLESAMEPLPQCLDRFSERLKASIDTFSPRLDNASHNLLQSVEGMRESATDLRQGTQGLEECYDRIEATYARIEQVASQVAGSQAQQQERLSEIAAGLHGITESLTSVVASANETQETVSRLVATIMGAAVGMESGISRFQSSVERMAAEGLRGTSNGPSVEGVTLRRLAEQQQQFINLLDHRLARMDRTERSSPH